MVLQLGKRDDFLIVAFIVHLGNSWGKTLNNLPNPFKFLGVVLPHGTSTEHDVIHLVI